MLHPLGGSGGCVGERGELGEDEDRAGGAGEDGAVARPGGSERGQEAVGAGEGVADGERFGRVRGRGGGGGGGGCGGEEGRGGCGGLEPEVEEGGGGGDGGEGVVGEEVGEG